ncbi:isopentenyl-diphosphate delta-isomerase [Desulforamulus reducens MI-1]|uniref:Isopentenyl-diphosphate delta-isomerase n=1 Tax=Desulforamulus reducens (strain ATCC BAA-1160 / DSM 100696 / MI-1) TaxID=349161 RepID=A4J1R7_DESRM|nr:type 2 isopentenyl-diphosphate Delta-isomerase [Desulforamulus reducens]ABO49020.1 isopentenyl-diphosphate delta-isomerase [Desulforamulus reducens MI-1]
MRLNRKLEHIQFSLQQKSRGGATGFDDITLLHNSLPQLDWGDIDTSCYFLGKKLHVPLLINAMTGGHRELESINGNLAKAAAAAGVALAVGSQRAALEDNSTRYSFSVVREVNPQGVVLANLGADCSLLEARTAIKMINADGIQLHLNAPQELAMAEGDRKFKGILENIQSLSRDLDVPVIVKEVGFGMSRESIQRIGAASVPYIDVGGAGGTDFVAIEEARAGRKTWLKWGIPTAVSLLEGLSMNRAKTQLIASGGIRNALDIVKSLSLGCSLVGMARPLLRVLVEGSSEELNSYLSNIIEDIHRIMLMLGARTLEDLQRVPLIISGNTYHWLCCRGIDVAPYARRAGTSY